MQIEAFPCATSQTTIPLTPTAPQTLPLTTTGDERRWWPCPYTRHSYPRTAQQDPADNA